MKHLNEQDIKNTLTRFERCLDNPPKYSNKSSLECLEIVKELSKKYLALLAENKMLREYLFDAEQGLPEEQQWQNILAAKLELAISSQEKRRDYLEITSSINNEAYTITIQKKRGNTPEQLLKKSEIRRLKAVKKVTNLHKTVKELSNSIETQRKTVDSYRILFFDQASSLEGLADQRGLLMRAAELWKTHAVGYNARADSYFIRLKEVPTSCFLSLQEAWQSASREADRANRLQREVNNLKNCLGKLKRNCMLYNKKRGTY
jgi:hypothetical protein